jgi:thymidylate kinase
METYKIIFVTGVSGTGKSAVLRELRKEGRAVIGIDEEPGLTTWINKKTGKKAPHGSELTEVFLATHDWSCDIERLKELMYQSEKPTFICGSADNVTEIMALADVSLLLVCAPETFTGRIDSRAEHDYGKDEASRNALLGYYSKYNQLCLDNGAVVVDAERSIEKVTNEVLLYIQ